MTRIINQNFSKVFSLLLIIIFCFTSCNSKPHLKDFDLSKLKRRYKFDMLYTNERYDEQKSLDTVKDFFDGFTMMALLTLDASILLDDNSGGFIVSENRYNRSNVASDSFDYRIEKDSIIYIKIENLEEPDKEEFIKSALLLEYDKNYEYFIIKPLIGVYKNYEFKAVEIKK